MKMLSSEVLFSKNIVESIDGKYIMKNTVNIGGTYET